MMRSYAGMQYLDYMQCTQRKNRTGRLVERKRERVQIEQIEKRKMQ